MQYIDTHCHIHSPEFYSTQEAKDALNQSVQSGVEKIILVGTSLADSKDALAFAHKYPKNCWVSVGIHPHEAAKLTDQQAKSDLKKLADLALDSKVVAIGECGFDFYYNEKSELLTRQELLLRAQLTIALENNLPLSFHVRDAFEEFWRVLDEYTDVRGVLHSFTDQASNLERALEHGLSIGINGIATFTTHSWQKELFKQIPVGSFVLETDSPFLTPRPKRGNINSPENVIYITEYLAELRGETKEKVAKATTANALKLFNLT